MKKYGIIGYPLGHSLSKEFFNRKFEREGLDCVYENFELSHINLFPQLIKKEKSLIGLNVTLPYKVDVIQYLDKLDHEARDAGAVNVVKIDIKGGRRSLKGFNSDIFGFVESLRPILHAGISSALILGTGGASKAVAIGLKRLNIGYRFVSRTPGKDIQGYPELTEKVIRQNLLIINSTPVGMFPDIGQSPPIPYQFLTEEHLLFDLVYNPAETIFLQKGLERGSQIKNGLEMLELQAVRSWEIWNDKIME
ncbi:MAG TPA: shikimate dehydrogenase [Bacteroidales bacterium]|nr:shikimate dehydrogenase [Bacteroidales bacterium]